MQAGVGGWRFWLPVVLLSGFTVYVAQKMVRAHLDPEVATPRYGFTRKLPARRGAIYSDSLSGRPHPLVRAVPYWEYRLDPVSLTNRVVRPKGEKHPRAKDAIVKTIADATGLDFYKVREMANATPRAGWRNQFLARSDDSARHDVLANSKLVTGVKITDTQVREYLHGRRMSHVLGAVSIDTNGVYIGAAGIELARNAELTGEPGLVNGLRDAHGQELYDKRQLSLDPVPGDDVYLTIDDNLQFEAEDALKWGLAEYGAGSGWCIVMDPATGAVLAMASLPDYDPEKFGRASDGERMNRAIAFNYEPGSVMKVITAAAAVDSKPGFYTPSRVFRTNRDDPKYYRLPGDGSHVWEPTMTLKDAIVHSSNIVIGKLGYDLGPETVWTYMRRFGFGDRTKVGLPGEQFGILHHWKKWDKATWSRAAIGQGVSVTAIQLIGAYQAIANDGVRMRPYIISRIVGADGTERFRQRPEMVCRAVSATTARTLREMMMDVASPKGTARRAAIRGYSIAGKTGTAQKALGRSYVPGLYRASFCGIVPAMNPRFVVLVTLDFDAKTKFHQGGNSAGPVFKRIAMATARYLGVPPDRPEELADEDCDEDEYDRIVEERRLRNLGVAGTGR